MNKTKEFIRENIIKLLEEDTKFSEGDSVLTSEGDKGIVTLSKHPFYAVQLDNTGTTHSYHFTDLQLNPEEDLEDDFGKYDVEPKEEELQESAPSEIIHMDGILNVHESLNVTDVLSDIRSIIGVTVVRPIDIPGETHKTKLSIKIDPFPFKGLGVELIKQKIKIAIRKVPGVREFWTSSPPIQEIKIKIKK